MDRARMGRIVYYIVGVIEVLLAFRLVFQLLGASLKSGFVQFIYSLSGVFNLPFSGIFSRATTKGVETVAVFDPSTIIAMIVYAILAWGIVKLLVISAQRPDQVEKGL
ncbi:MAG: YggT family protein [Candidatus Moraniibacteriota bacterium]|nr:MAG: YggT family protein [Candidatus Moranbacteria bacterium]